MRRRFFNSRINNNFIIYTSSDNLIVIPFKYDFGATIISNAINNNVGKITFNSDVTIIGNSAFSNCYNLTSIEIPNSVTSIGNEAFYYCENLTSVVIGNSVTNIESNAFAWCYSLTNIEIPNSVTTIGDYAFWSCLSLKNIVIPDSVTSIGNYAFSDCTSLTSIEIPNSVTSIGDSAFYECSRLSSVYVKATTPPTLGKNAFDNNVPDRKFYVPSASLNAYMNAEDWSVYVHEIVPYDPNGGGEITFPITLVEGDNGDIGRTFFEYVKSGKYTNNDVVYLDWNGYKILHYNWYWDLTGNCAESYDWDAVEDYDPQGPPTHYYISIDNNGYLNVMLDGF